MREFMRGLRAVSAIFCSLLLVISILPPMTASAAINPQINFQGKLTNPDGTNVTDGTYSIVFSIYTVASGGSAVWTETQGSVSVTDGIFRVALGSVTSLPGSVDFNGASLYLGIKVGADAEMTPRVQFTASPYAFNSDRLGGIAGSGFVQLGQSATAQADASTNSAVFINKTAAGNLIQLQSSATDVLTVSGTGDILFGQNANHTISVSQEATNANGNNLTLSAGQGGAGAGANAGGLLVLQGGAGGGTNGAGGNLTLAGGAGSGTGASGAIIVKNPADSINGFQIQDAAGTTLFVADSTNDRIYIGSVTADAIGTLLVLDTKNTTGDPSGVNAGTYYNSALGKFRCFENGAWRDCSDSARTAYFYTNDFMGATSDGDLVYAVTGAGAANSATAIGSVANHPGVMQQSTGTTATGNPRAISTATAGILLGNNTVWVYETVVRTATLSSATQRYTYRTGFIDSGTAESVDGCFYRYSDNVIAGDWQGVCRNNNTETSCDTNIPVAANTWVRLTISINAGGTSADFATDGTSRCQVATNIPTGAGRGTAFGTMMLKSVGTTASTMDVDYVDIRGEFTATTR